MKILESILSFDFLFLLFSWTFFCCNAADMTDISRLRSTLLENYDSHSRPVQNHKNYTEVEIYIFNHGFEYDEVNSLLTLHCLPVMHWKDEHLKWDPLNYGNLTELQFFPTELWRPDLMVYNNLDKSEIDHFANTLIVAYNNSNVYWVPPAKFQVRCESNYLRWPYDIQNCLIILGSWSHDGLEVNLTLKENHTVMDDDVLWNPALQNREWNLLSNSIERSVTEFSFSTGVPYIEIIVTLNIQRRSFSHTAGITVVAIGIAAAILISFWLDPFANERLPVILVSIFLNAIYLNYVYRAIPYNGSNVPYAVAFFRDSLMMVTVALLWTVLIRYIAKTKRTSPVPLPDFVQKILESVFATILCLNPRPTTDANRRNVENSNEVTDDNDELVKQENPYQEDWAWLAHLLDRLGFLIYFIVYASFLIMIY